MAMTQIAIVVYPGFTALDFIGPYEVLRNLPDEKVLDWVRQAHQTATWTASVCSGSVILAAAGLLEGKRATSHWICVPMLKTFGVTPVGDERIVVAQATP